DAQPRSPFGQMRAAPRQPARDFIRRERGGQRRDLRPADKDRLLNGSIVGAEDLVVLAQHHGIAELFESLRSARRCRRAKRRTDALVAVLMEVEAGQQLWNVAR